MKENFLKTLLSTVKKNKLSEKWISHFAKQARLASEMSKDRTKVGCVIVGKNKEILSTGFNGFPKGVKEFEIRKLPDFKLFFTCHAEQNALDLSKAPLDGAILFTTHFPCANCARSIIQNGISEVYYEQKMDTEKWKQSVMIAEMMLQEAKIKLHKINPTREFLCVGAETSTIKNS